MSGSAIEPVVGSVPLESERTAPTTFYTGEFMTARRFIFPVLWLVVFAVIAAGLFKLAFVDGLKPDASSGGELPTAQISTPLVPAALGTVNNVFQVQGAVVSNPAVTVKSTGEGTVDFIYVEPGEEVVKGTPLIQLKIPVEPAAPAVPSDTADASDRPAAPSAQLFTYADVVATAPGTVERLSVLLKQQLAVGAEVASLDPGTFSVTGTLTSDQQFRILSRTSTATVTVNGGPAPFPCSEVSMGKAPAAGAESSGEQPAAVAAPQEPATGSVSCAVPADVPVFGGLGATIEITAGRAENVVTVPTTAVRGTVQNGVVWVVPGDGTNDDVAADAGEAREREVTLGLNDGKTVEIASGLVEGEMVLQFVPGAPAEEQGNQLSGGLGG